ncbi:MAG TPA: LuxR C-terminal-related transcriptional regulator [Candidatus Baltobacteraceae bacterium]|nr:LuxR C-terminal-related transcriptional regulator [Candidatus Baltobacteraceae bacterium]
MRHDRRPALESLDLTRADYRRADFSAAAHRLEALLDAAPGLVDAALLLARTELRRGDPSSALSVLARHTRGAKRPAKGEAAMLKAVAFARLGDDDSSRAQFRAADSLLRDDDALRAELTYHLAASEWIERRLDRASKLLDRMPQKIGADLDLHVSILRGAIASANEHLPAQGAILLEALRRVRAGANVEVYLYAMLVTQIAALAVELPGSELRDAAIAHVDTVPWTRDIGDLHFHAVRAIAWRHALEGDEFNAFRRLKQALAAAGSDAWRVAALTDRAYLAAALGERRWAAQELRDAHELASTIDWNGVAGEEKLALPVLAQLFAPRDASVAIGYVTTFGSVGKNFPRILSSRRDRRVQALEAYSLGKVQLALGEVEEARRLLANAWTIYERLGIEWRAARAALALADIDESHDWRERATAALTAYPRSWLVRRPGEQHTAAPLAAAPETANLTAAQRVVFDLLLEGRGTEEIARTLGRSAFTVRNHIKAIFKAYGVSSRSALIVKATRGTSQT